jgi:hypothetical protein
MSCRVSGAFAWREAHSREMPSSLAVAVMLRPAATEAAIWSLPWPLESVLFEPILLLLDCRRFFRASAGRGQRRSDFLFSPSFSVSRFPADRARGV